MALLVEAILALIAGVAIWNKLLTPNQKKLAGNLLTNFYAGAVDIAQPLLSAVESELQPIASAFLAAFQQYGGPIAQTIRQPIADVAHAAYSASAAGLAGKGPSTPDNALDTAATAFADAFGFGISSAAVTAAFEAAFPEKLNTLNGVGPMLANMAGFEEVAGEVLGPLYRNAFGRSLEYHFRSVFKPELPREADAVEWHSRRLLTDDQLRALFEFSGLKPEYETPFVASAYRGLNPRTFASMFVDETVPHDTITAAAQFYGLRDDDITFLLTALDRKSTQNVRQQYLAAVVRSAELGTITPAELDADLTQLGFSDDAKSWVQLTVATRRLEQLAELYRKSIAIGYETGQIADADYVPALEAIGITAADAQAHYAIDSMKLRGKNLVAAAHSAQKLETEQKRAGTAAAIADYHAGKIDDVALTAALVGLGVDAETAAFLAAIQVDRRAGSMVFLYGVELPRNQALLLRERVAAFENQYKKQLITDADVTAALAELGIPEQRALALIAAWAALKSKKTATGEKLPV